MYQSYYYPTHYHNGAPFPAPYADPFTVSMVTQQLQAQTNALEAIARQQREVLKANRAEQFRQEVRGRRDKMILDEVLDAFGWLQQAMTTSSGPIKRAMLLLRLEAEGFGHGAVHDARLGQVIAEGIAKVRQDHLVFVASQPADLGKRLERAAELLVADAYVRRALFFRRSLHSVRTSPLQAWRRGWLKCSWAVAVVGLFGVLFSEGGLSWPALAGGVLSAWLGGKLWRWIIEIACLPDAKAAEDTGVSLDTEDNEAKTYEVLEQSNLRKLQLLSIAEEEISEGFVQGVANLRETWGVEPGTVGFRSPGERIDAWVAANERHLREWIAKN